jgi:hypothetical protein
MTKNYQHFILEGQEPDEDDSDYEDIDSEEEEEEGERRRSRGCRRSDRRVRDIDSALNPMNYNTMP